MSQTLRVNGLVMLVDPTLGSREVLLQRPAAEFTRTTTLKAAVSQAVTTTATAINVGNVTAWGEAVLWNDETDPASATYISLGFDVGGTFYEAIRLSGGPSAWQKVSLSPLRTWQVKTNSSTAQLSGYVLQRNA